MFFILRVAWRTLDEDGLHRVLLAPISQAADMGVLHSCGMSPRACVIYGNLIPR